ncbi:hypothetical protein LWC34_46665 [Kibdelosporangium philippinense]|uniref:MmpS family membrane protein n=1 Tax=Kibdelosporangium philippinense TaxID=211113 RepID=A0ABS8ZRM8_9PSEU|nr:hypothetical protein [Kibdelosporangium philippinense]MCE7010239.1 hypothetical protein [Kibdelosporangium philippinense]
MDARMLLGATAVIGVLVGASACSNPSGKSWAITYEVTDQAGGTLSEVNYSKSPNRYQDEVTQSAVPGPVGVPWKMEVVVTAGQRAEVTAKPTGKLRLTCRILLDGTKELARATAPATGEPVTCAKQTDS